MEASRRGSKKVEAVQGSFWQLPREGRRRSRHVGTRFKSFAWTQVLKAMWYLQVMTNSD